jgi:hypothetical protein
MNGMSLPYAPFDIVTIVLTSMQQPRRHQAHRANGHHSGRYYTRQEAYYQVNSHRDHRHVEDAEIECKLGGQQETTRPAAAKVGRDETR